jgi:hypothetical protein
VINIFQEKKNPSSYKDNNLHDNHLFYPKLPPTIALNNNISQVAEHVLRIILTRAVPHGQ